DLFAYNSLSEARLGTGNTFDVITDFNTRDRILAPLSVETDRIASSIGNITSLSESSITSLLNAGSFAANSVAAFTVSGRVGTFMAMNDGRDGFQAESDAILFLQNYAVSSANFVDFA
ncbi:MAG: bluetail domain-containing putative surface protein, partial [Dolichospermum sp.]